MGWWDDEVDSYASYADDVDTSWGGETSGPSGIDYNQGWDGGGSLVSDGDWNPDWSGDTSGGMDWGSGGGWGGTNEFSGSGNFYGDSPQFQAPEMSGPNVGGIQNTLSSIFSGMQNNPLVGKGLAAILEGVQNKKKQSAMNSIAGNQALDPWGSQRGFYQQQAQQAVTNPYDSPIVKAQVEQMQRAQNIKDAAAGRRSNSMASNPALMAEMAKVAQQYQAQMAQQGGAGIAPNSTAMTQARMAGVNSGVNGYISPLLSLLGNTQRGTSNQNALQDFLSGG